MWRGAVVLVLLAVVAGCGEAGPPGEGSAAEGAPGEGNAPVAQQETPEGDAVVELTVEPSEIAPDTTVTFTLVNRGEVELMTGMSFTVERWDGQQWVGVPLPDDYAFTAIGIILVPGEATDPQQWPVGDERADPGWHRIVKSASYEDPEHTRPDVHLVARAPFRVGE